MGTYDCEYARVCEASNVPGESVVLCNHANVSCTVTGTSANVKLYGGVGGANATFRELGKNASVDCEMAPFCSAAAMNVGGLSKVNCDSAGNCKTDNMDAVDCGSATYCSTSSASKVDCKSATTCNITEVRDAGEYNCTSAETCTVQGNNAVAAGISINVYCGSASSCSVNNVYFFSLSFAHDSGRQANACSGVPQTGASKPSIAYCISYAQCANIATNVERCFNFVGDPSGGCFQQPPTTSPPTTAPPTTITLRSDTTAPPVTSSSPAQSTIPVPSPPLSTQPLPPPPPPPSPLTLAPPPPPPPVNCVSPPTPDAVCVNGTWFVPPTVVGNGQVLSFSSSTQLYGDLILTQNSTLQIFTVTGAFSTLVEVSGCVRSDNASLVVDMTSEIGDMRSIDLVSTACFSGGFASTKINARSTCQKYNGHAFYNGARLSVLLQNDEAGCQTKTKYVVLAMILCVVVLVVATVVAVIYCYRERDRQRRLRGRNPNSHYTNISEK